MTVTRSAAEIAATITCSAAVTPACSTNISHSFLEWPNRASATVFACWACGPSAAMNNALSVALSVASTQYRTPAAYPNVWTYTSPSLSATTVKVRAM